MGMGMGMGTWRGMRVRVYVCTCVHVYVCVHSCSNSHGNLNSLSHRHLAQKAIHTPVDLCRDQCTVGDGVCVSGAREKLAKHEWKLLKVCTVDDPMGDNKILIFCASHAHITGRITSHTAFAKTAGIDKTSAYICIAQDFVASLEETGHVGQSRHSGSKCKSCVGSFHTCNKR